MNEYLICFVCACIVLGYLMYYVSKVELFNLTIPMTFRRQGNYATFDPPSLDLDEFDFQVYFKTLKDSGLILMVQTVTFGFLLVVLEEGFVKVILSTTASGDDAVVIQSHSAHLNDGLDHLLEVQVSRYSNMVDLHLNDNLEVSAKAGIHATPLGNVEHVCLGGLSNRVKETYKDVFHPSGYDHLTFKGCLIEPRINQEEIIGPAFLHETIYGCWGDAQQES